MAFPRPFVLSVAATASESKDRQLRSCTSTSFAGARYAQGERKLPPDVGYPWHRRQVALAVQLEGFRAAPGSLADRKRALELVCDCVGLGGGERGGALRPGLEGGGRGVRVHRRNV